MRVAALQLGNYVGDKPAARAAAEALIRRAVAQGAQLVVLPELSACGYIPNPSVWQYAEAWPGETAAWACAMGRKYAVHVGAGFLETDGRDYFNAWLVATPEGEVAGRVHKMKTEVHSFKSSDIGSVIETGLGRVAVGICADTHVVGFHRRLAALDFDVLVMPHAWATPFTTSSYLQQRDVDDARRHVAELGGVYAAGFGVPVVFANAVGEVPPMPGLFGRLMAPSLFRLRGGSAVFGGDGAVTRLEGEEEGVVVAEVVPGRTLATPKEPRVYGGWLHSGSRIVRSVIAPIDVTLGRWSYRRGTSRKERAR